MGLLVLFSFMFGFLFIMTLTTWVGTIVLTSFFSIFDFRDEFIEYWIRTRGSPPSRRRLILNAYGACNTFFIHEICNNLDVPNGLRIIPNSNYFHYFMLQFAGFVVGVLFWIWAFFVYFLVRGYF